jgi:hypothetical protein
MNVPLIHLRILLGFWRVCPGRASTLKDTEGTVSPGS